MVIFRKIIAFYLFGFVLVFFFSTEVAAQCAIPVNSYPFQEDFESGAGGWVSGGTNDDWALGTPSKATISGAGSGTQCWITGGLSTAFYNYGERSWVLSPCFDFSGLTKPVLSALVFWDTEYLYDGASLQYSIDGGVLWITLGTIATPVNCVDQNWYNVNNITNLSSITNSRQGWSGTVQPGSGSCRGGHGSGQWVEAKQCVSQLAGEPDVVFRFIFGSGTTCNDFDGFAFDRFRIEESTPQPVSFTWNCIGDNKIQFDDADPTCHDSWTWDFGDPYSSDNTGTSASMIHTFQTSGLHTVTISASSSCLPSSTATQDIYIMDVQSSSTPASCPQSLDGTASVTVTGNNAAVNYQWNTDPVQTTATITGISAGQYAVTVNSTDACTVSKSVDVPLGPNANPPINLGKDTTICPGSSFLLKPGPYASYTWQDSSSDSTYLVNAPGEYWIRITNSSGCYGSDTLLVQEDCLNDLLFPNAFSPNGDAQNEEFKSYGSEVVAFNIRIFNRWGQVVYVSDNAREGWDGRYLGRPQEDGVYIYKATYSTAYGERREKTGSVMLIR